MEQRELKVIGGTTFAFSIVRHKQNRSINSTGWTANFIAKAGTTTVLAKSVSGDSSGRFIFRWEASETTLLDFTSAKYNLNISDPSGTTWRVSEGTVILSKGV